MSISGISSNNGLFQMAGSSQNNQMSKIKQNFSGLGDSLEAGDLEKAKLAFAQLQKNISTDENNPMNADMERLGQALEDGDLEAAQKIYGEIQEKMANKPAGGPPSQAKAAPAGSSQSSGLGDTYDKMDANKDGTVSPQEKIMYMLEQQKQKESSSAANSGSDRTEPEIDTYV